MVNPIHVIFHIQYYNKKYFTVVVETNKQVYMFYQSPYQSNTDYIEVLKAHLKIRKSHNGSMRYHPGLAAAALLEKYNITGYNSSE